MLCPVMPSKAEPGVSRCSCSMVVPVNLAYDFSVQHRGLDRTAYSLAIQCYTGLDGATKKHPGNLYQKICRHRCQNNNSMTFHVLERRNRTCRAMFFPWATAASTVAKHTSAGGSSWSTICVT
jgi:hypothetical protein